MGPGSEPPTGHQISIAAYWGVYMNYKRPQIEIILFSDDIITTSGWNNNGNGNGNGHWFGEKPGHGGDHKNIVNTQISFQDDSVF